MEAIKPGTVAIESDVPSKASRLRVPIALLAALCTAAIVIGLLVSSFGTRAQASPAGADRSYDQIEYMRGAHVTAPVDTSYDRIEYMRGLSRSD